LKGHAEAFSPAGLSGIFRTHIVKDNPMLTGAWGAGLALKKGVYVNVRLTGKKGIRTFLNGEERDLFVSKTVANTILEKAGIKDVGLVIEQKIEIPIGGGLGSSGASALATALAVAKIVNFKASYTELAQIAHVAELINETGLGTVSGLATGGAVIVRTPGAPGYDRVDRIIVDGQVGVVIGFYGPRDKREVISSSNIAHIDELGERLLRNLIEEPSIENFVKVSREFAERTGLMSPKVKETLNMLKGLDIIGASMAMIGDTVFVLADTDILWEVQEALEETCALTLTTGISWEPAKLL